MMYYDPCFLEQIEEKVDLLEYVSQNIEMHRQGCEYFGSCPLHVDKTPSFSITPSKNKFYCFSCGNGGGIISYLIKYENLSFDEAVKKAAQIGNVDFSKMCQSKTVSFLRNMQKRTAIKKKFSHPILSEEIWDKYSKDTVYEWISEGIRQEEIDYFDIRVDKDKNRIVYPVRDISGKLINIKGRTRFDDYKNLGISKYINYFKVGSLDYFQCLDKTMGFISEKKEVIIFESIKSVMKCFGWGYKNCVSAETHYMTDEQIKLIIQLQADVVFAFDKDVDYSSKEVKAQINKLKRFTNVYVIYDYKNLLGNKSEKNSPADLGKDVWKNLYQRKRRVL